MSVSASEIIYNLSTKFDAALASGELLHFPSTVHQQVEDGINFQIRLCPALAKKSIPAAAGGGLSHGSKDPFTQPYNPHLHVGDLQDDESGVGYAVLLNKYSVIPHHFILVTKEVQSQTLPLMPPDLVQTYQLLLSASRVGRHFIAFYNCGQYSGASQSHKHIQFIPIEDGLAVEQFARNTSSGTADKPFSLSILPYANHAIRFPPNLVSLAPSQLEQSISQAFLSLLDLAIATIRRDPDYPTGKPSYNVIMTLEHMYVVPRRSDTYTIKETGRKVGVNSLGVAGHLLAKCQAELDAIKYEGILKILSGVGLAHVHDLQVAGTAMEDP